MDFFTRQEQVRRHSRRLVWLFVLAMLAVLLALNLVMALFLVWLPGNPQAALPVALLTTTAALLLMGGAALHRSLRLRPGGVAVTLAMGAVPVAMDPGDASLRRLRNVVEEMAIACGAPLPLVAVLDNEPGINAFAAGHTPADAAIVLTRGALEQLDRDELQAVVAHEFGHILSGDIRLDLRLLAGLSGIVALGVLGRQLLLAGRIRRRQALPVLVLGLALAGIGALGLYLARLVRAAISRQREFLADAQSVQFTRQPDALIGAFLKIAGNGSRLQSLDAEEISHMLFEDGRARGAWMASHPPLLQRIRAIRPGFRAEVLEAAESHGLLATVQDPVTVAAAVGQCRHSDHERAAAILGSLPEVLERAARDRNEAGLLLCGLLLAEDPAIRQQQYNELLARAGLATARQASDYAERLRGLSAGHRLPLAMLALAAVKLKPLAAQQEIADLCFALTHADRRISLFEYALGQLLRDGIETSLDPQRGWRQPQAKAVDREQEIVLLLALMAHAGHATVAEAQRAFMAALPRILPQSAARYTPPMEGPAVLDDAVVRLDELLPKARIMLIEALVAAASNDGRIAPAEAELLRVVCALLRAPLPAGLALPD